VWKAPTIIRSVIDRYGREIYRAEDSERRVVSETTSYLMTSMMADVLDYGTAAGARAQGLRMRAAGKTGTSQDYSDAWFVGFTPSLVTGVWFGYDTPRPIMDRGFASVVAVPAWTRFMIAAMRGQKDQWFDMPGSLVKVRLCRLNGLLAGDKCNLPVYELPPYDPAHPDVVTAGAPTMRESGVYEEIVPADRVPPYCTLPHGVDVTAPPSYYEPLTAPAYQRSLTMPSAPPPSVPLAPPYAPPAGVPLTTPYTPAPPSVSLPLPNISPPAGATRPVTPPPPFMTEKPAPAVTVLPATVDKTPPPPPTLIPAPKPETVPPAETPPRVETAKPEPPKPAPTEREIENPLLPSTKPKPPAPAQPADAPIVPGATINRTPPGPPPPRSPGN
jgi:membrane peptidoglycan carboxypeptidase